MQGPWPNFGSWMFEVSPASDGFSESAPSTGPGCSNGSGSTSRVRPGPMPSSISSSNPNMSHFSDFSALSPSTPYPSSGNVILGGRIIAVLQAAGGFLWLLKNGDLIGRGDPVASRGDGNGKNGAMADIKPSKLGSRGLGYGGGIITVSMGRGGAASLLLNRVTSLVCDGWGKLKMDGTFPAMLAAILPPLETSYVLETLFPLDHALSFLLQSCFMGNLYKMSCVGILNSGDLTSGADLFCVE